METKTYIDIQFNGDGFSPKTLRNLTKLPLEIIVESGEIASKGRYKEKKSPFGIALLKIDNSENVLLDWSKKLISFKDYLKLSNVGEIIFDIQSTNDNFKNFTITSELANNLSVLNAKIKFNKIEDDNLDEVITKLIFHISHTSSIPSSDLLQKKLEILRKLDSDNNISAETTYGLIVYMFESLNNTTEGTETESFKKFRKEYHEL